jgi:GxxExxY protein
MFRIDSPLDERTEMVVASIIGASIAVHRELGPGLLESAYHRALCLELEAQGISYRTEAPIYVSYRGERIIAQRLDLLVDDQVVVELKSVQRLEPVHTSQVVAYLRASKCRAGLLINFNCRYLREGIKRVVL